jgi:hypothetical protein
MKRKRALVTGDELCIHSLLLISRDRCIVSSRRHIYSYRGVQPMVGECNLPPWCPPVGATCNPRQSRSSGEPHKRKAAPCGAAFTLTWLWGRATISNCCSRLLPKSMSGKLGGSLARQGRTRGRRSMTYSPPTLDHERGFTAPRPCTGLGALPAGAEQDRRPVSSSIGRWLPFCRSAIHLSRDGDWPHAGVTAPISRDRRLHA